MSKIKQAADNAIRAAKAAHAAAWTARQFNTAHTSARDAAVAHLVAAGALHEGIEDGGGRAPICGGRVHSLAIEGATLTVDGGYNSNGPRDVWGYVTIRDQAGDVLATTGRLKA